MLSLVLGCILLSLHSVTCCDFSTATEWSCLPCGGPFTCTGTESACFANAGDVPGCSLIDGATNWMCCAAGVCTVTGTGVCDYHPSGGSSSSGNNGGGTQDTCLQSCSWFQTCKCTCWGCKGVGSGCFTCKTQVWFTVIVVVLSVAVLGGI